MKYNEWTYGDDAELGKLRLAGYSAKEIGARLSPPRSEGAVHLRLHRLLAKTRKTPYRVPKEYSTWNGMISRCFNTKIPGYRIYGAKGITVCDRWRYGEAPLSGFQAFLEDMGPAPSAGHSLDRFPNRAGNYEPGNVRWATSKQQANNTKKTRIIEFRGKLMALREALEMVGSAIPPERVWQRMKKEGIGFEDAVASCERPYNGRGRPPIDSDKLLCVQAMIRLGPDLIDGIDALRGSIPRSTFIRNLIEQAVSCVKSGAE